MISREELVTMFANIRQQTPWNINGEMLWGFFFHHPTIGPLQIARGELERRGYTFVNLFVPDAGGHTLHVERVEAHTVDTLHARNQELERLASQLGIDSYDGMDVGPTTAGSQPPLRNGRQDDPPMQRTGAAGIVSFVRKLLGRGSGR